MFFYGNIENENADALKQNSANLKINEAQLFHDIYRTQGCLLFEPYIPTTL